MLRSTPSHFHQLRFISLLGLLASGNHASGGPVYDFRIVASFDQPGLLPNAGMTLDSRGNLTEVTGAGSNGVVINTISTTSPGTITAVASLPGGVGPTGLSRDPSTGIDYVGLPGAIKEFDPNDPGKGVTTFAPLGPGVNPLGGFDLHDGKIALTTVNGGGSGQSSIALYSTSGTLLHSLTLTGGYIASGGPTRDVAGNYFFNASGGPLGQGAILEANADLTAFTARYTFTGNGDGSVPTGKLAMTAQGMLIGETYDSLGTLFRYDPTLGGFSTLVRFTGQNGSHPLGGVVLDAAGNAGGVTYDGGQYGFGTAFVYNVAGMLDIVHQFSGGLDGGNPGGRLVEGPGGVFYGTTGMGGENGGGDVFALAPAVPEPASLLMTGGALAMAVLARWRYRRRD